MRGWHFSAKPSTPYQRKFRVTLFGLRWFLNSSGTYDDVTDPKHNARLLELFYQQNQTWSEFSWNHPHLGELQVRFAEPVNVPRGVANGQGLVEEMEVMLVEWNPSYG